MAHEQLTEAGVLIVGVDGSAGARHAFHWAIEEARVRRSRLRAVHAWDPARPVSPIGSLIDPADVPGAEQSAKELLEDAIDDVLEHSWVPYREIEPHLERGYPPKILLSEAAHADLLVVGTRGHGELAGLVLGSVSRHCVNRATRPIAVIPTAAPLPDASDVVVGVDGSKGSKAALRFAVGEAALRVARLVIVHSCWEHGDSWRAASLGRSARADAAVASACLLLSDMSDEAKADADRFPTRVELLPVEAPPASALLDRAKTAGLLVVGSRGRGRVAEAFLGSVTERCVHRSPCAVVVVPHHES
jgi:nucleotide-binding universal stress UspA family protein